MVTKAEKLAKAKSAIKPEDIHENIDGDVVLDDETKIEPVKTVEPVKPGKDKVIYKLRNGQIREFSKEVHGADYKAIAEAFKNNGKKLVVAEL